MFRAQQVTTAFTFAYHEQEVSKWAPPTKSQAAGSR